MSETIEEKAERKPTWNSDLRVKRLVNHLLHLAQTADSKAQSRAALAELRQATMNPLRAARHVAPYLGSSDKISEDEHIFYTVAGLFAIHRKHQDKMSLGKAFRRINDESGSIEKRFFALLAADAEQLEDHVRHAVRLLASKDVPLDWHRLTEDMLGWDKPNKPVQMKLAREFYSKTDTDTTGDTDSTTDTTTTMS